MIFSERAHVGSCACLRIWQQRCAARARACEPKKGRTPTTRRAHLAPAEADGRGVMAASLVAIMSTFVAIGGGPMIYGYVRPNFWRKRSVVFLVTFIVDSVVIDLASGRCFRIVCVEINQ